MGLGKTYSTKYLLDSNNSSGVAGQVLSTTSTGIDWADANTLPGSGLWLENGNDIYNSNSGNVGIGVTGPSEKLSVNGNLRIFGTDTNAIQFENSVAGTRFHYIIPHYNAGLNSLNSLEIQISSATPGNEVSVMTLNGDGNVGIGTTTLTNSSGYKTLSISGSAGGQIAFQTSGTGKSFIFNDATDFYIYNSEAGNLILSTAATERMRITSAGGISFGSTGTAYGTSGQVLTSAGNASPTWTTPTTGTVTGTGVTGILPYWTNGPGGVLGDSIVAQGSQRIQISSGGGTFLIGQWDGSNNRIESSNRPLFITSYTSPIKLGISGSTTMTIESSNVGIGTTSPQTGVKLDVRGNVRIGDGSSAEQDIHFNNSTTEWQVGTNNAGNGTDNNQFYFYEGGNYRLTVQKGGNVGIGTTSPSATLHVKNTVGNYPFIVETPYDRVAKLISTDSGADLIIQDSNSTDNGNSISVSGDTMGLNTAGSNRIKILANGNVGIGTTNPQVQLHVAKNSPFPNSDAVTSLNTGFVISGNDGLMDLLSFDDNTTVAQILLAWVLI